MALAITTKENVKALLEWTGTGNDALIDACIASVSDAAESFLGRTIVQSRKVEEREIKPYVELLSLYAVPIVSITAIVWSDDTDFSDNNVIESTEYVLLKSLGQLKWKPTASVYRTGGYVQVTYMAGMASDQTAFQAAYPDIEFAAREEVVNILNRRKQPGGMSTVLAASGTVYDKELTTLSHLRRALGRHKRWRVA